MFGKLIKTLAGSSKEKTESKSRTSDIMMNSDGNERIQELINLNYSELFSVLHKNLANLVDLPSHVYYDNEVKGFCLNYFGSLLNVIMYYHQRLGNWDEKYIDCEWTSYGHPRLNKLKELEFHIIDSIYALENRERDATRITVFAEDATYRHEVSKRLTLHLFLIFDVYCTCIWNYLKSGKISNKPLSIHNNKFFEKKYYDEVEKYNGLTKNIIVDFFFSQIDKDKISYELITVFKILIKWRIPLNKAISGFPDGDLVTGLPVTDENDVLTRHAQHLAPFLALQIDDFNFSPMVFTSVDNIQVPLGGHHIFIPSILDNSEIQYSNLEKLIPEEYRNE